MCDYFFATKNTVNGFCDKIASYELFANLLFIRMPGLLKGGRTPHRNDGTLTGSPGLLHGGWASHRKAGPLTRTLGL